MKRAIEWVDDFYCKPGTQVLPSTLMELVTQVRSEALETAELVVRRMAGIEKHKDARATLEAAAESIALAGRSAR